jgi:hypothetical protein
VNWEAPWRRVEMLYVNVKSVSRLRPLRAGIEDIMQLTLISKSGT